MNNNDCSITRLCNQITEFKYPNFENKWSQLIETKKSSIDNEILKTEIENINIQFTNYSELNGNDFIYGKDNQIFQCDDLRQNLIGYLIDQNTTFQNVIFLIIYFKI